VSYIAHDGSGRFANAVRERAIPGSGTAKGTVSGLFIGLAALAIPGIGPAVAAGPIALALAGAAAGGLLGALADTGVPETQAKHWAERVAEGGCLVIVRLEGEKGEHAFGILSHTADEVRVYEHGCDTGDDPEASRDFPSYGSEGGPSEWGQRVLSVKDDEVVIRGRTISRDKETKRLDNKED
jgi:hypothetical protein